MAALAATAAAAGGAGSGRPLPPLRDDLRLLAAPPGANGAPAWNLYDPVRHQYFRIGRLEFELLSRWHLADPDAIAEAVSRETSLAVGRRHVAALAAFVTANRLVRTVDWYPFWQGRRRSGRPTAAALLRRHLYTRLPLWRPDAFLEALLPAVRPFYRPAFWLLTAAIALIGLALTLRRWDTVQHTFVGLLSPAGMIGYGVAMALVKLTHELGHAFTAKRYGLRVPVMGVAFILFWPMLFTDTTDAWRLTERRQRLAVGVGGIAVELAIAAWATLIWHFLAPGVWRDALFLLATTSWLASLAINVNPFMRFDGYYLLADLLDVANLQERAFALGRWHLRQTLLALELPRPETLPGGKEAILVCYAYCTWLYRLFVFTGIALLLYHLAFKALGIMLLAVDLFLLIGRPVAREGAAWWRLRRHVRFGPKLLLPAALLFAGTAALVVPWQTHVAIPALCRAECFARIFPPVRARIETVACAPGEQVAAGAPLFELHSPRLDFLEAQAEHRVAMVNLRLKRLHFAREGPEQLQVVEQQLIEAMTALAGYRQQRLRLRIVAPVAGEIVAMDESLRPGRWVNEKTMLAMIADRSRPVVEAFIPEKELAGIDTGLIGRFYPQIPEQPAFDCRLVALDRVQTGSAASPGRAAPIRRPATAAALSATGASLAVASHYRGVLEPLAATAALERIEVGTVRLPVPPRPLYRRIWQAIVRVLIQESEF